MFQIEDVPEHQKNTCQPDTLHNLRLNTKRYVSTSEAEVQRLYKTAYTPKLALHSKGEETEAPTKELTKNY